MHPFFYYAPFKASATAVKIFGANHKPNGNLRVHIYLFKLLLMSSGVEVETLHNSGAGSVIILNQHS